MTRSQVLIGVIGAFTAGLLIRDVVTTERVVVLDQDGSPRIQLGVDPVGNGELTVLDRDGNEVFAIRRGEIVAPRGDRSLVTSAPAADLTVVQVIGVETIRGVEPSEGWESEAILTARAEELEAEAVEHDEEVATLQDEQRNRDVDNSVMIKFHQRRARELRAEARKLVAQVGAQRRAKSEVRQRITAWDGERTIILLTARNMANKLGDIGAMSFISFRGRLVGGDTVEQTFEVADIRAAQRPPGFRVYEGF